MPPWITVTSAPWGARRLATSSGDLFRTFGGNGNRHLSFRTPPVRERKKEQRDVENEKQRKRGRERSLLVMKETRRFRGKKERGSGRMLLTRFCFCIVTIKHLEKGTSFTAKRENTVHRVARHSNPPFCPASRNAPLPVDP